VMADLKDAEYRDAVHALAREAAVVVEQFHPRVLDRLARGSAGYDDIATTNSAVLYCSITGYGQWGRTSAEPGTTPNYLAEASLLSLGCDDEGTSPMPPTVIADIAGGARWSSVSMAAPSTRASSDHAGTGGSR